MQPPNYLGHCDVSARGSGGVWYGAHSLLPPIVWRAEWPRSIRSEFNTDQILKGTIYISDLEMETSLLYWLVLEQVVDLSHKHVDLFSNSTPTVAWITKMCSVPSGIATRLLRILSI